MSQAEKIYNFLTSTTNEAADGALLQALDRAQEPYGTVILEMLLDRGRSAAMRELITRWHQFNPDWQKLMVRRASCLYGGLFQAGRDRQIPTRLNALSIIRQARFVSLAELVAVMLRDNAVRVSQEAADILLSWARYFKQKEFSGENNCRTVIAQTTTNTDKKHPPETLNKVNERVLLLSALEKAVRDYPVHRKIDALRAAMCIVPAHEKSFWKDRLEPHSVPGQAARQILINTPQADLAGFCLSALNHVQLRPTAMRLITQNQRSSFIVALAQELLINTDKSVLAPLALIKQPRWLDNQNLKPDRLTPTQQSALVKLVAALGGPVHLIADYLAAVASHGAPAAALEALNTLTLRDNTPMRQYLEKTLTSQHEIVVLAALKMLLRRQKPRLRQMMVKLLTCEHKRVRRLARNYLRNMAFESYWNNFDRLSRAHQIAAGRAIFKIDPAAGRRWREKAYHASSQQRLQAVQMARILDMTKQSSALMRKLADDPDQKVRSCAVAGLGELKLPSVESENCLWKALKDTDNRVRANAIEALQRRGVRAAAKCFELLAADENNRVRANAVKALLIWKVSSSRQAIRQMMADPRPRHRRSARWVARQMSIKKDKYLELSESDGWENLCRQRIDDRAALAV